MGVGDVRQVSVNNYRTSSTPIVQSLVFSRPRGRQMRPAGFLLRPLDQELCLQHRLRRLNDGVCHSISIRRLDDGMCHSISVLRLDNGIYSAAFQSDSQNIVPYF